MESKNKIISFFALLISANIGVWIWAAIGILSDNFGILGFIIIGVFVFSWIASLLIYRLNRYDEFKMNV